MVFLFFKKNNRKRKGIDKPKRDNVLPWDRQFMGEWNDLVFFTYEIRNVPLNIQFYISIIQLDSPLSDYFFISQIWLNYLFVRKFKPQILKKYDEI